MTFSHIKNDFSKKLPDSALDSAFAQKADVAPARTAFARIAIFVLLVLPFLFASCSNLFDDISSSINNHNSSDNANGSNTREVLITGGMAVDSSKVNGAVPSEMAYFGEINTTKEGRFAIPSLDTTGATYTVTATAPNYSGTRTGTAADGTFSIALELGYKWTITLEMKTPNPDSSVTTKLKGTYTYDSNLSESNVLQPVNIVLAPIVTSNGTGSIDLYVASDYQPEIVVNHKPQGAVWESPSASKVEGSNQYRINVTGIKSGVYDITLVFKNGNTVLYSYDQAINVFDSMTTNTWIEDGASNSPINGHSFEVTQDLIKSYARTNFYVSTSGNDTTGDGSSVAPFATVSKVLSVIGSGESGCNYVIRLMSDIQDQVLISTLTSGTLTIKGYGANRTIKNKVTDSSDVGNYTIKVQTQPPVTLENITIDGAVNYPTGTGSCMGLVAERYTNVTLKNCTITKTNRDNGNAIWSKGTVTLEDCTITHCRSTEVTDTAKSYLIVNSEYGVLNLKNCTISGNTARCIIYNTSNAVQLKLDGNISIPVSSSGDQRVSIKLDATTGNASQIKIGDAFTSSGSILLELPSYTPGTTVLVPETNGASSVVASAASKFTLTDGNYSIGTSGDDIGKLVVNPNIYVADADHGGKTKDEGGNGSQQLPYLTVKDALAKIKDLNVAANYVINITGVIKEAVSLSNGTQGTLGNFNNSTLTIQGSDKSRDMLDGTVLNDDTNSNILLNITCDKDVTIKNLTICNVPENKNYAINVNSTSATTNVNIENCNINNNKSGGIAVSKGTVTINNCSITENSGQSYGAGLILADQATVTVIDSSITRNSATTAGGGVSNNGTLKVQGNVNITGNTGSDSKPNNVYLYQNKVINVSGILDTTSSIGVSLPSGKPEAGTPVLITNNQSGMTASQLSSMFTSDASYEVMTGTGSATNDLMFVASGGDINTSLDYSVVLSCANTTVAPGSVIKVNAAVTNNGTTVSAGASDITWSFTLYCLNDILATIPSTTYPAATYITTGAGYASLTIPTDLQIYDGLPYTLHAVATYKDAPAKDENIPLTGSTLGFAYVSGATVSGAVGSGDTASVVFIEGRTVEIPNMYVCDHEVTRAEYAAVMGTGSGEGTVNEVSWFDALVYCNKLSIADGLTPCYAVNGETDPDEWSYESPPSGLEGLHSNFITGVITCNFDADGYRLPTEAEWEYTARDSDFMNASLREWCWDYSAKTVPNNDTPATGILWNNSSNVGRFTVVRDGVSSRYNHLDPGYRSIYIGFRVVRTIQ
ncbi:MAG: SUMF1/EgtB/PvdO family nonheme iron enzyme [Spirochaetaceae bacterium]|nr:SUMF1/EgtB/PvdO family nonheme iron enzyme [Spirochaetaceae bacterium]